MKRLCLFNSANLGDNILQMNYMRRACIARKVLFFHYACKSEYIPQLSKFIDHAWAEQIQLVPLEQKEPEAIDTWIGTGKFYYNHPNKWNYDQFYVEWFNHLSTVLDVKNPILSNQDVLLDHPVIVKAKDASLDILFINCPPNSGQLIFHPEVWERNILRLSKKYKVLPLHPVPGIISTLDLGLDVLSIGSIACGAKRVIGVCTGPLHACFNTKSIQTVEEWHIFTHDKAYTYNNKITMHKEDSELDTIE